MIIFINSKFLTKRLRLIFLIVKKYSHIVIISQKGIVYYVRNERNNSLPTVQTNSNIPLDEESIEDNSKSDFEENLSSSSFSIQVCSLLSKLYTTLVHEKGKKDDSHSIYHIELSEMEELLCYFKEKPLNEKSPEEPLIQISNSLTKLLNMERRKRMSRMSIRMKK